MANSQSQDRHGVEQREGETPGPEAFYNRGRALREQARLSEALASFDQAIALKPDYAQAFNGRGGVLQEMKRLDEALASFDRAIALKPDYADAFNNRGIALKEQKRLEEALASYDSAIALKPDSAQALNNRGNVLTELKRLDEAQASYDKAIALRPDFADAFKNRAHCKLLAGRYEDAWLDYEWRFDTKNFPDKRPTFKAPVWNGEDLAGRSLVVYGEQGIGDAIQFVRYLPLLRRRKANVTFITDAKTARLLQPAAEGIQIIDGEGKAGRSVPAHPWRDRLSGTFRRLPSPEGMAIGRDEAFDFQCALLGLPLRFKTDLSSIPDQVPYLYAEHSLVARWKKRIGEHGFKVGIAWQGTPNAKIDRGRSIPLAEFAPLARVAGVRLISLQKHHGLDQLAHLPPDMKIETLGDDFDEGADAFIDTAAVMANLDLIVTSDTAAAHLAGALGRPVWLALKYVPDWRWMLDREDSPWYPTMRLFRQQTDGDWPPVFAKIARELQSSSLGQQAQTPDVEKSKPRGVDAGLLFENSNLRVKACKHGAMMFYANDKYIGKSLDLYGEFSDGETRLFEQLLRPGMTVIDAGANIGAHTVCFAKAVGCEGRVLAFEPQRTLHQILCGNVALNQCANVVAIHAGLGAKSGDVMVPRLDCSRIGNFGGLTLGTWEHGESVRVHTLDSYDLDACHFVKIDVEGMEREVLEGAEATLAKHQPILYVENDREEKSAQLVEWLLRNAYRLFWHLPPLFNPKNYFRYEENVFGRTVSINMLCVPQSHPMKVTNLREITSPEDTWRTSK